MRLYFCIGCWSHRELVVELAKETYAPEDNESATKDAYKTLFVVSDTIRLVVS